ncbi:hypothetical protein PPTG_05853 [Phytophthora nicotianae INRA-310]|uniref:Uncharacterized protein n=1 Tax=Phytophthora nicotianae (strain INRA-310) TaxID=761204 RepID=W2QUB7_PHYN3|nr:hypothetical protein PPTG_05853 [Phytophthora nicotianae INRA-310]ETN16698.1 hypothetical protein PPTG_05853 [Phytophthora nicotianae INRA-310]
MRTIMDRVRALLLDAKLPKTLWAECVSHVTTLLNMTPSENTSETRGRRRRVGDYVIIHDDYVITGVDRVGAIIWTRDLPSRIRSTVDTSTDLYPWNPTNHRSANAEVLEEEKAESVAEELKAPAASDSDSLDEIPATWSGDQLEEAFNRNELQVFLAKNPVMKILQLQTPGSLKGPVKPPPAKTNKINAVKGVLRLLKDAGITPGPFAVKDLFHLDLEAIQITQSEIFKMLKVLVREAETQTKVDAKPEAALTQLPGSASPTGSSQHSHYASATSMADSDTSEGVERMQLGPSGAAMLQTRSPLYRT